MRRIGLLAVAAMAGAVLAAPLVSGQPAIADCAAPTVKFRPARVARGAALKITGQYFGDDCLDTGTLPEGVGQLGTPMTGLVVVIDQGTNEFVVANGSADDDYEFEIEIVVPAALEPGEAVLAILGAGDARMTIDPPLVIADASPIESADETVATFGPSTIDTEPPGTAPPVVLPAEIPDEPVAVTVPTLSTVAVDAGDDNSTNRQRAISAGVAGVVAIAGIGFVVLSRGKRRR